MIFAFSTDDCVLKIFLLEVEAIAYAEGVDVEDGGWDFFDKRGLPLEAVFVVQNQRGRFASASGTYFLRRAAEGMSLTSRLHEVAAVEGPARLDTVGAVKKWLEASASKQSGT